MGISGSIYWQDQPESFTEDEIRAIFQDEFDQAVYDQLKDANGCVNRDALVQTLQQKKQDEKETEIREVYKLFMGYSPSGDMNCRAFTLFIKDAKLLRKKTFTTPDANILFERAKVQQGAAQDSSSKTLHFPGFMKVAVPMIAEKIGLSTEATVHKLARVEHKAVSAAEAAAKASANPQSGKESGSTIQTPEDAAAVKLQRIARGKLAQKHAHAIKQMNSYHEGISDDFFDIPNPDDNLLEQKLQDVFITYCPSEEMDGPALVSIIKEASLLDQKFTVSCVHIAFMKARHIAHHTRYESKVVLQKRLLYDAFREVAIPCVAESKGCSCQAIVDALKVIPTPNVGILGAGEHKKEAMGGLFVEGMKDKMDEVEQMHKLFNE